MNNEKKIVRIASSGVCGINISIILEALENGNIIILDNEIIDPLEDRKEVFELKANIDKTKRKHNWEKNKFWG